MSDHLSVLHQAGLVTRRRDGRRVSRFVSPAQYAAEEWPAIKPNC
jgi:DNA-binding transcriptional ArsR family regulator